MKLHERVHLFEVRRLADINPKDVAITGDRHSWLMMHIIFGILFVVFARWYIILNRRPMLNYIKASTARSLPLSRGDTPLREQ